MESRLMLRVLSGMMSWCEVRQTDRHTHIIHTTHTTHYRGEWGKRGRHDL